MKGEVRFFGVPLHPWTLQETLDEIDQRIREGRFTQHVVVNVAKLVNMQADQVLRAAVEHCDIINIDGAGVVFGMRFLGMKVPGRVAGIDLFERLLDYSESTGRSVYLLGARPKVLKEAVAKVRSKYPRLRIAGYHHGYFWDDQESVVQAIRDSGAELLFVGVSSPRKERFIEEWKADLGVRFAMGVGGSFDIIAGYTKRAPLWMQKIGLEWFYRLLQEPKRMFMRYVSTNAAFAWMLMKERLRRCKPCG
jgi:N-acetylglucosaminyldiphosphoundecaprenol N-acetyl-beta-D-mannosaminyltransferase